jgi:hypothetical protein
MKTKIRTQSDLQRFLLNILDENDWEICREPTPEETIELIEEESGQCGVLDPDTDEIIPFSINQVEPLTEETWMCSSMSDHEKRSETDLRALIKEQLPGSTVKPVELSRGIEFAGDLVRCCFRVEVKAMSKQFWVYVRQVDECDSFLDRCSGPMWDGY